MRKKAGGGNCSRVCLARFACPKRLALCLPCLALVLALPCVALCTCNCASDAAKDGPVSAAPASLCVLVLFRCTLAVSFAVVGVVDVD